MKARVITRKEMKFAQLIIAGMSRVNAFREVFKEKCTSKDVAYALSSMLYLSDRVQEAIRKISAEILSDAVIETKEIVRKLDMGLDMALGLEPQTITTMNKETGELESVEVKNTDLKSIASIARTLSGIIEGGKDTGITKQEINIVLEGVGSES